MKSLGLSTNRSLPWLCVALWVGVVSLAAWRIQPGMYSDPGWGILAAEQTRTGHGAGMRTLLTADRADLERDVASRITWWPPTYQAVPAAFMRLGLDWGAALRVTAWLSFLAATVGWAAFFGTWVSGPALGWLVLCIAMCRYAHASLNLYDGEGLAFAVFPWVLLLNHRALTSKGMPSVLVAGAATTATFAVKYSLLVAALALCATWAYAWWTRRIAFRMLLAFAGAALAGLGLLHLAEIPGGPTPGSAHGEAAPLRMLEPLSWLSLAATDLDALLDWALRHPTRQWLPSAGKTAFGLAALAPLAWLTWSRERERQREPDETEHAASAARVLSLGLLGVIPVVLTLLLVRGAPIDDSARHVRMAAVAALPLALHSLRAAIARGGIRRLVALAMLGLLFVAPAGYGATTLLDKAFRRSTASAALVSASGVRLDLLGSDANAHAFYAELRALAADRQTVFYWTSPDLALELADRRLLVRHADFVSDDELRQDKLRGCPRAGVVLVLPTSFEANGKAELIRTGFVDVPQWHRVASAGAPGFAFWLAACGAPGSPSRFGNLSGY